MSSRVVRGSDSGPAGLTFKYGRPISKSAVKDVDRLLAALQGREFDRIPFTADLAWWYEVNSRRGALPVEYKGLSLADIAKDMGILVERYPSFYRVMTEGVERVEQTEVIPDERGRVEKSVTTAIAKTPLGSLRERSVRTSISESQHIQEHMVKSVDDMRVMRYVLDHSDVEPIFEDYRAAEREDGDHCSIQMVLPRSPIQRILIEIMGYKNTFIALHTHPREMEGLMRSIQMFDNKVYQLAEKHTAKVWEFGENIHCEITNPVMFRKYNMPYYEKRVRQLHAYGKILYIHMDGCMRTLLPLLKEMEFDAIQGFAPKPQGDFTIAELREAVEGKMALWGGIPANILCGEFSDEYVEKFMLETLKAISPGDRFIFGIGDMLPPNGYIHRVKLIERLLEKHGHYPIDPDSLGIT